MKYETLKPVVNNFEHWMVLEAFYSEELETARKFLETAKDPTDIYRQQGKIELLKKLLKTREIANGRTHNS
jgi:hypothetical protein